MKVSRLFASLALSVCVGLGVAQGTWQRINNRPPQGIALSMLLTDGTVMCHNPLTSEWYKLTPDAFGSYVNGKWTKLANMPNGYGPLYYASGVLKDGRVVVIGGEYNLNGGGVWTNLGAVYDPVANTWTPLQAPNGWANVGDAQCVVLPDGRFLLAMPFDQRMAVLNPNTMTWSAVTPTGKTDRFDEEGWILLPDNSVLTVDAINAPAAERLLPDLSKWIPAGATPQSLEDPGSQELGPMVLRPDGTVFACGATGHNAVYTPGTSLLDPGAWTAAPDFPVSGGQLDIADGPACLLTNGHVLADASPGVFNTPCAFFEFDGTSLLNVPPVPNAGGDSSYVGNMLMLPTGQVMFTDFSDDVEIYNSTGAPLDAWRPKITTFSGTMSVGATYTIKGQQFNGLSQSSCYGDDSSNATNYPLVRLTNKSSGHVFYARTSNHSTMSVATGSATVSTNLKVPTNMEQGPATMQVVANGIASPAVNITIIGNNIAPSAVSRFEGVSSAGGLTNILNSDNSYFTINSISVPRTGQIASGMVTFQFASTNFTGMGFSFESSALTGISALYFIYDWTTNKWVAIGAAPQGSTDKVTNFTVTSNISNYINSSKQTRILIRAVRPGNLQGNPAAFTFKLDQVKMSPQ
jgi:hypothetical protein